MSARTIEAKTEGVLYGIVQRLILLETALQLHHLRILPAFDIYKATEPVITIQLAGAHIARHLGLEDLTFLLQIRRQSPNVAGRIHLQDSDNLVEIEIDEGLRNFEAAILGTLCHEVTHKYLSRAGIEIADRLANEKLTDTAAVFLGMGAFMVEASYSERTTYTSGGRRIDSLKIGYLTTEEFSLTLALLEEAEQRKTRLCYSDFVSNCLNLARSDLRKNSMLLEVADVYSEIASKIDAAIKSRQRKDVGIRCFIDAHKADETMSVAKIERSAFHKEMRRIQQAISELLHESNRRLAYFKGCRLLLDLPSFEVSYSPQTLGKYKKWKLFNWRSKAQPELTCPSCEQNLRTKNLGCVSTIRCPRCSYKFLAAS